MTLCRTETIHGNSAGRWTVQGTPFYIQRLRTNWIVQPMNFYHSRDQFPSPAHQYECSLPYCELIRWLRAYGLYGDMPYLPRRFATRAQALDALTLAIHMHGSPIGL